MFQREKIHLNTTTNKEINEQFFFETRKDPNIVNKDTAGTNFLPGRLRKTSEKRGKRKLGCHLQWNLQKE